MRERTVARQAVGDKDNSVVTPATPAGPGFVTLSGAGYVEVLETICNALERLSKCALGG
jgi:hypothetical protein